MIDNLGIALTDNDAVKALECCTSSTTSEACNGCPLFSTTICTEMENGLQIYALDLIKRQQAEIERLYEEANHYQTLWCKAEEDAHNAKSEAIKEFAAKLKESAHDLDISFGYGTPPYVKVVTVGEIDNLVKERTEEYAKTQES